MTIFLRQSTASQEIPLGYFVDATDGNTEETALTINNTDIKVWKTGATTLANKNSGGGTHISNGIYYAVLDATDTDTIGPLRIFVHVTGALAVKVDCVVLDEAVYDVLFGTSAITTGGAITVTSGRVNADITHIATAAVSTSTAQLGVNVVQAAGTAWGSGAITAASIAADAIGASELAADAVTEIVAGVWGADATSYQTQGTFGQAIGDPVADTNTIYKAVVTDATGATVGVDAAAILADTGTDGVVVASIATGAVTAAAIADGAIDAATFAAGAITAGAIAADAIGASELAADAVAEIADAVWDEAATGHTDAGKAGEQLWTDVDAILVDTGTTLDGRIPAALVGGRIDANVGAISTDATAADNAEAFFDGTGYAGTNNVVPTVTNLTNLPAITSNWLTAAGLATDAVDEIVDGVWDEVLTAATHNVAASAGRRLRTASGGQLDSGTAQTGGADSITLATSASTTAGLYVGCQIAIDGGTGAGQSRYIVGYTTGRVAYVARHWTTAPDNTSTYVLFADNQVPFVHVGLAQAGGASSITLQSTGSATNDIYNGQLIRVLSGTGDDQIRVITDYDGTTKVATVEPAWTTQPDNTSYYGTLQQGLAWVTQLDSGAQADIRTAVGLASANLDTNLDAAISTRATPAQVNAEVVDALNVDTYAEPGQGAPAATATLAQKLGYLYKAWRNKKTQTSSQYSLFADDAATVDQKSAVSDDGSTTTIGEVATGP